MPALCQQRECSSTEHAHAQRRRATTRVMKTVMVCTASRSRCFLRAVGRWPCSWCVVVALYIAGRAEAQTCCPSHSHHVSESEWMATTMMKLLLVCRISHSNSGGCVCDSGYENPDAAQYASGGSSGGSCQRTSSSRRR